MAHTVEDAFQAQQIEIKICADNNGQPGETLTSNIITLSPGSSSGGGYSAELLSQCAKTNVSDYHWIVVLPLEDTDATWVYSNEPNFIYSTTENNGGTWADDQNGFAGTSYLTAEQIYIPPFSGGDINGDFIVNVLDIVFMVQYVLGNQEFTEEQLTKDARLRPRKRKKAILEQKHALKASNSETRREGDTDEPQWSNHKFVDIELLTPVLRHYVELKQKHPKRIQTTIF